MAKACQYCGFVGDRQTDEDCPSKPREDVAFGTIFDLVYGQSVSYWVGKADARERAHAMRERYREMQETHR